MKIAHTLDSLRYTQNKAALQEIGSLCPVPQPDDRLFERSWQKYQNKPHPGRLRLYRGMGIAACLLLTIGLLTGVYAKQQRIDTRPPQDPAPAMQETTEETQPRSETAAETAKETAAPMTTATEAALIPVQTQPETVMQTTEAQTQAVISQETQPPVTEAPAAQPVVTAPAEPVTEIPVTEVQTRPATEAQTEPATQSMPEQADIQLTGFAVMQYPDHKQVICTDDFPEPDGALEEYHVAGHSVALLAVTDADAGRTYDVEAGEKTFTVTQREYAEFILDVEDESELIDLGLNRSHGFFLLQGETCTLYWFRSGEGFCMQGNTADLRSMLEIARSFTPAQDAAEPTEMR